MKTCSACGVAKPLDEFHLCKTGSDKRRLKCKECACRLVKEYRAKNSEKTLEVCRKYKNENREAINLQKRSAYQDDKEKQSIRAKLYRQKNLERLQQQVRDYREENRAKINSRALAYAKENPHVPRLATQVRRAFLKNAVPSWANSGETKEIYRKASELEKETGIKHHVDHIVPLNSKLVCGFHVANNLQILTASENMRKHNKLLD